jgi:hypothetical protein
MIPELQLPYDTNICVVCGRHIVTTDGENECRECEAFLDELSEMDQAIQVDHRHNWQQEGF